MISLIVAFLGFLAFGVAGFFYRRGGFYWFWRVAWSDAVHMCFLAACITCYYGGLYRYGAFHALVISKFLIFLGSVVLLAVSYWFGKGIAENRNQADDEDRKRALLAWARATMPER
ncbi:MAG TPA: hypothetical protein VNG29_04625 [Candidatus Paceibacterota bacterium]|nr:hypothetical protein [Candidatus Paceibacterota bacterium]